MVQTASEAPIAVLVTDVEGSTDLHTRFGDAAARDLIRGHERTVRSALAAHEGREIKTMGDGFLVTFASTRRALECAIAIQRELAAQGDDVRVRIGMHCGELIHEDDDIHGAVVAAAVRIMERGRGGDILVSDLVRQLAGTAGVAFQPRATVPLKGLDGRWNLYAVTWRSDDEPATAPGAHAASGLIGREVESTILHSAVDDALRGRGRLVLLAGEPGIGKTTLADDAAAHATAGGAEILWGGCWEGEGAPAFWPWIQAIRAHAAERTDDELAADAGTSVAELCRLVPELAARLPEVPQPPDLEPEEARVRLFDGVASFLYRSAARRPLLLVLDDLHWADVSSMHLLTFLAAQLATNRVAIVGTYRDTEVVAGHALHSLMQDAARRGQLLPVRGLDPDEVAALMASVASTATLRTELANAVHRQTAGNPLFVGEVTRLLAQQHALDRDEVSVGIPQGVREVIERRMVRLPQRCIELLTLGAVVGEEFRLDTVARAASIATPELVAQLEPAIAAGVAREASGEAYRFAHSLFREALYDGQGTIARAGLHLQIATALEQRHLQAHDVGAAELANHFGHAALTGETDKAVHYATIAGHEASSALAYSEAVHHFERALQVLDLAPHLTESDRAELLLDLSGARWRAGDRTGALAEVERAIFLARRTGRGDVLARAAVGMHRLGGVSGVENNERLLLLREAHDALGDEETPLRVRVLAALAKEQYHAWLHLPASIEGLELAEQAVAIARRLDNSGVLAEALAAYHDCLWFSGKERLRFEVATELEQVALVAGDREQAVEAVLLQSVALLELADHEALPRLEMFIQQAEALPNPRFAYLAATRRATVAMVRGDIPALERALEEAGEIGREHAEPDHINVFAAQVFCLKTFQRRRSESVAHAREAYLTNKAYRQLIDAAACLGLLDEGKPELARAKLETVDIDEISSRFRNYGWLYETAVVAEAAAALGDDARMATLSELLEPYAGTCIIVAGAVNFYGCAAQYLGLMARARGRAEEAAAYFATALDAYERLGATWWADQVRDLMSTASEGPAANQLRRDGSAWTLDFGGTPVTVRDAKGIRDLAVLLAAPGREVAAADLVARGEITAAGADAVLDERARREFGARLAELDGDLAEADAANDLDRIALIKTERDALAHELAAALGLGGRERKLGDPAERARKAVAARLRDAIERIAAEHPELGQHLRASVSTGTFCSYAPPSPTSWRVTDSTPR